MNRPTLCTLVLGISALVAAAAGASPLAFDGPAAPHYAVRQVDALPTMAAAPLDLEALRQEDLLRREEGLPPRFAVPEDVFMTPATDGVWEQLDRNFDLWRLRVQTPGALSVNFGFTAYRLPKGGRLTIHPARDLVTDDPRGVRVFTDRDNEEHGQLWTPVVVADDVVIELILPRESRHDYELALTSINQGYRLFGEDPAKAGACNIDVICPEGDDWRREINSVAVYSRGGSLYCTGFMVNNTSEDLTPYFQTANHCGITDLNAASLVVYWNFQSPACGDQAGGPLTDFQTGAVRRANSSLTDFTLLELDDAPDPAHQVSWAGWNRATGDFASAVSVHHPSADEKSISFEDDPTTTTSRSGYTSPGDGLYIRVADWDLGTTEDGSSGAPLFDPDHRVVGQLYGGYAACGNNESDWYGRFSVSWNGQGSAATRLRDWLDPGDTGALTVDTVAPWSTGMAVTPADSFASLGIPGGPFAPDQIVYTVTNRSNTSTVDWSAATNATWLDVSPTGGTLAAAASVQVTVTIGAAANSLGVALHSGTLDFVNLTDGDGDTSRRATLLVGEREPVYTESFDTNPGWFTSGLWAFGQPTGGGGAYGEPDPTSGATGLNVYGYNLDGDYESDLPERYLMATPYDCTGLQAVSLRFQRWLGVESPDYDHASIQVSAGGTTWVTVWENQDTVTDLDWTPMDIDISAVADGQPLVFVRWTMGTTDDKWHYCGWNIDDVEIWALTGDPSPVRDVPTTPLRLGSRPNPFNPSTVITFELPRAARARLEVFDTAGRKVATLVDRRLAAGPHQVNWRPRRLPSGVYVARLEADGETALQRMTLLK
ncbi:MAG: T9SS type A sorting domain-containing protein [bacterium]|nr:T9SS type A sorting domain-containing protein [bacterium]